MGKKQKRNSAPAGESTPADAASDPQPSGRKSTLSLAIPGSCIESAPSLDYAVFVAAQLARAAVAYQVDEIVVFDEAPATGKDKGTISSASAFLGRVLQYLETPPYLRSTLAPKLPEFTLAASLPPIGAPHHPQEDAWLAYREGVVLKSEEGVGSYVDVGLDRMVYIQEHLPVKARVTVSLGPAAETCFMQAYSETMLVGKISAPGTAREALSMAWGYSVRLAGGLQKALRDCPFHKSGYDLTIGVSNHGIATNPGTLTLPHYKRALLVLDASGSSGSSGIEPGPGSFDDMLRRDPDPYWSDKPPQDIFNLYISPCPSHPGGGLRAEDAALASLAYLLPALDAFGV